jgi:hypothetical protein
MSHIMGAPKEPEIVWFEVRGSNTTDYEIIVSVNVRSAEFHPEILQKIEEALNTGVGVEKMAKSFCQEKVITALAHLIRQYKIVGMDKGYLQQCHSLHIRCGRF